MHISLHRSSFLDALARQQTIVAKKTTIPVLSHVLLQAQGSILTLTGTNLEMMLMEKLPIHLYQEGECVLSASLLYDIVRKLCEEELKLHVVHEERLVKLSCGAAEFKLSMLQASHFPPVATQSLPHQFSISGTDFKNLIEKTRFAVSCEEGRYTLNGIYLHRFENELRAVATDTHRLALSSIPLPKGAEAIQGAILGRRTIQEIAKLILDDQEVHVALSTHQIAITWPKGARVLYSRLVEGSFPDYQTAIPQTFSTSFQVNTQAFMQAVDRVNMVISEKKRVMKLTFESSKPLILSGYSPEFGFASDQVQIDYQGKAFEVGFNPRYLLDIFRHVEGENVEIFLGDGLCPTRFYDPKEKRNLYILMPAKLT